MKIKVCDAPIEVLNYLVAKIECLPKDRLYLFNGKPFVDRECLGHIATLRCEFSTNWAQGGPIIERENITIIRANDTYEVSSDGARRLVMNPQWFAEKGQCVGHSLNTSYEGEQMEPTFMIEDYDGCYGPTPLISAMRCYCCAKLGEFVDIPEELCPQENN